MSGIKPWKTPFPKIDEAYSSLPDTSADSYRSVALLVCREQLSLYKAALLSSPFVSKYLETFTNLPLLIVRIIPTRPQWSPASKVPSTTSIEVRRRLTTSLYCRSLIFE
jgi:hypothetical protein